jgi:DNA polymerase-1
MSLLLLVDGSSYLYRAFHALPDLRNKAGEPTGAVYGVISMLRRLEADFPQADRRAIVFDAKGKTFRDDWYPEYKAHRPPMPDDLVAQIEPLHQCVRALGWPLLMIDGVEADDVIGTLACQAAAAGSDCVVSTGDKDLAQLVNPRVKLVNTMNNETLDEAGVLTKFGVPPNRIVDYLTLVGDTVDNVPGVAKVGPKTAVKWLTQYGSLDSVVEHAAEIGGVVGENLRQHLDFLPMGRKLVTVACDLDLPLTVDALQPEAADNARLAELFARLEFKTLLREVQGGGLAAFAPPGSTTAAPATALAPLAENSREHYETLFNVADLDRWLAKISTADLTALDTETTSLDAMEARLVGISFAVMTDGKLEAAYLPLGHNYAGAPDQLPLDAALVQLKPWFESPSHAKVGQHLKYDRHVFANHGIELRGISDDTLLASYVLESDKPHDLGSLASRHLGLKTLSYDDLTG